ncbi:MAG TPA: hypothetical protein VK947_06730 [Planococcus sp. (in: firmicutes)]|nr:hypothetical protein [Planococcus sp. (in: firmicutes)]
MTVKEERVIFEYELSRLSEEYLKCLNLSLKQQIQEDIELLKAALELVKNEAV